MVRAQRRSDLRPPSLRQSDKLQGAIKMTDFPLWLKILVALAAIPATYLTVTL
jgi:hypothetical protein